MRSRWRAVAAPIIAQVIAETRGQSEKEVRKAVSAAYPFGLRRHHPYKIWLDEVRRQLGPPRPKKREAIAEEPVGRLQLLMFEGGE